jgi:S-adenosylmethionine decarboxylase
MEEKHYFVSIKTEGNLENFEAVYDFLIKLAKLIDMKILTKPYLVRGSENLPGITGFLIIETSHIAIHTFSKQNYIAIDIYSCKDFDENKVREFILNFFKGKILLENVF